LHAYLCRFRVRAPAISLEVFLGSVESRTSVLYFLPRHRLGLLNGFAYSTPSLLGPTLPSVRFFILLRHPVAQTIARWYRNINLSSIAYAFRPQLRSRLTLSGRTFLRNPWAFGERDSHSFFVTHTGILTSTRSISPHDLTSLRAERSPTAVP